MNVCMHLVGPLERQGDQLVCPWHNATFSCRDGKRQTGPTCIGDPGLIFLPILVEDETLHYVYGE